MREESGEGYKGTSSRTEVSCGDFSHYLVTEQHCCFISVQYSLFFLSAVSKCLL